MPSMIPMSALAMRVAVMMRQRAAPETACSASEHGADSPGGVSGRSVGSRRSGAKPKPTRRLPGKPAFPAERSGAGNNTGERICEPSAGSKYASADGSGRPDSKGDSTCS